MKINRGDMYEQYIDWCKKMDIRGKKLTPRKFGIKFGGYFPKYDENGNAQKAGNGRVKSIFTGVDNTNSSGQHYYQFPLLAETRKIVCKKIGNVEYDWDGGGIEWASHIHSSAPTVTEMTHKDRSIVDEMIKGNIIPIRGK